MVDRLIKIPKQNSFFLFGARGTGKSTLIQHVFPSSEAEYINLLLEKEYYQLSQHPDSLIQRAERMAANKSWIILDEVQRVPELLNVVHTLIEEKGLLFALSGSSSRKLKRGGANLLAGRAFRFELFPFTHQELGENFSLEDALAWGTLPRLFSLSSTEDKALYLDAYVETYLKEEIVAEQLVRKVAPFRRFLDIAAQMNTKLLNYSSIARDIGVSVDTVQTYFSILEDTHIGYLVPPYHTSIRKRQRESPKFYLFDRGVTRALERLPGVAVTPQTSSYGEAFEHFLFLELFRINQYKKRRFTFSFLRTKDNAEIDLIIERPGAPTALVEIKSSEMVHEEDLRGLSAFKLDFKKAQLFCLSRDPFAKRINEVEVLPWKEGIQEIVG